jgi:hypothetical protein
LAEVILVNCSWSAQTEPLASLMSKLMMNFFMAALAVIAVQSDECHESKTCSAKTSENMLLQAGMAKAKSHSMQSDNQMDMGYEMGKQLAEKAKDNVLIQLQGALKTKDVDASQHEQQNTSTLSGETLSALEARRANMSTLHGQLDATVLRKGCPGKSFTDAGGFRAIAHMTNTIKAVEWAIGHGANALEMDFDYGTTSFLVYRLWHGGFCDCSCHTWFHAADHVCDITACSDETPVNTMLHHLTGKSSLALLYTDNKVGRKWPMEEYLGVLAPGEDWTAAEFGTAGRSFANKILSELFSFQSTQFKGDVLVGVPLMSSYEFLLRAKLIFDVSSFSHRVYYTIDMETKSVMDTVGTLSKLGTKNLIYSVGQSACSKKTFNAQIKQAVATGSFLFAIHWTFDSDSGLETQVEEGVRGIMTNYPGDLVKIATCEGQSLQKPSASIACESGQEYYGTAAASGAVSASAYTQCPTLCREDSTCTFWTYAFGACHLKKSDATKQTNSHVQAYGYWAGGRDACQAPCKAKSTSTADAGYGDNDRGWYDVQGCGKCLDYCRWVGNSGSGGSPHTKLTHGSSWWSCRLAGDSSAYSSKSHFSSWSHKKCSGEGADAP